MRNFRSEVQGKNVDEKSPNECWDPSKYYLDSIRVALGSPKNHDHTAVHFNFEALEGQCSIKKHEQNIVRLRSNFCER